MVGIKHRRVVTAFDASDRIEHVLADPARADLAPAAFVRVVVSGDSFVLYQIRKMIAVALAVALGHVPPEVVPLTLHRPARFATPVAPAAALFLADAEFAPFTTAGRGPPAKNAAPKKGREGDGGRFGRRRRTRLGPERAEPVGDARARAGDARRDPEVQARALEPSLAEALASDEWERFAENLFKLRLWARGEEGVRRIARWTR